MPRAVKSSGKSPAKSSAPYDIASDLKRLRRTCKHIARALKISGHPEPRIMTPGFATLIRIISGQQVSTAAAASIWAKLKRACGGRVTPDRILALEEKGLRGAGFSGQKTRYALGLAQAASTGALDFSALARADDARVREIFIAHKGVGIWTADIYLMFGMGRGDVWPAGDLGLQAAIQLLHGLEKRPSAKEIEAIAEIWRPYRSSAAVLLWHYYGVSRVKAAK